MRYFVHCRPSTGNEPFLMHQNGCVLFPDPETVELLGDFDGANEALKAARSRFGVAAGCRFCCPECNVPGRSAAVDGDTHADVPNGGPPS
ncbi:MAG: hypothetical protein CVU59_03765 [Deltaproteobacteria bacterium HGW-Deltaproteobacteria-17]|nr:MAG: hypothetical protein CVU59_03765 [Deltaproteobacteria bacterium HGW-Deltaproteobacteria-17]